MRYEIQLELPDIFIEKIPEKLGKIGKLIGLVKKFSGRRKFQTLKKNPERTPLDIPRKTHTDNLGGAPAEIFH